MFISWVEKNAPKIMNVEGANFHVVSSRVEEVWLKHMETTKEQIETKILSNRSIMIALLNFWDKRNFEQNNLKIVQKRVDGILLKDEIRYESFRITQISGFLVAPHLLKFIRYLLNGFPPDDLANRVKRLSNTVNKTLYIPAEWAREELFDLRDDQISDIFLQKDHQDPVVDMLSLNLIFSNGERVGIVWINGRTYYMVKMPSEYSEKAFNTKIKTPPKPKDFRLEGPYTLTEWTSKKRGVHIFLFGDKHVLDSVCPAGVRPTQNFVDFIKDTIVSNRDKTIDIYVEELFKTDSFRGFGFSDNYMVRTRTAFKECLERNKSKCPYKNTRFHYTDVRNLGAVKLGWEMIQIFYGNLSTNSDIEDIVKFDLLFFRLINHEDSVDPVAGAIETRVQKQLEAVEDKALANLIAEHFNNKLLLSRSGLERVWAISQGFSIEVKSKSYLGILYRILDWISIWLDYYAVSRMFRSYKKSKNGYSSEPARNIIGYFGESHCAGISEFLRTLPDFVPGERSESMIEGKDHQCLKISSRLPLFKYD